LIPLCGSPGNYSACLPSLDSSMICIERAAFNGFIPYGDAVNGTIIAFILGFVICASWLGVWEHREEIWEWIDKRFKRGV
jgi:hypothetical protein